MTEPTTLDFVEALAIAISAFATITSAAIAGTIGWVKSARERRIKAEVSMREYRLKTCQPVMEHFSWIPEHGEDFSKQLSDQFYINFSKLSEFGHLVLSHERDMALYEEASSLHKRFQARSKSTPDNELEDDTLNFLDKSRREMKAGLRELIDYGA